MVVYFSLHMSCCIWCISLFPWLENEELLYLLTLHAMFTLSGLANPAPIIQTFYAEDQIFNDVKLDGVVTLVDAKHAGFHLDEVKPKGVVNEAVEQIAYADRIIVNKVFVITKFVMFSALSWALFKIKLKNCLHNSLELLFKVHSLLL